MTVNFSVHHKSDDNFKAKAYSSEASTSHWFDIENSNATITIFFESSDDLKTFIKTVSDTELE